MVGSCAYPVLAPVEEWVVGLMVLALYHRLAYSDLNFYSLYMFSDTKVTTAAIPRIRVATVPQFTYPISLYLFVTVL